MLDRWKNKQSRALEHNFCCEREPEIARLFYLGLNINKILWCFPQPTSNSRNHKIAFVSLALLKWIIHCICKRNITQKSHIYVDFQSIDAMGSKSSLQFSAVCHLFSVHRSLINNVPSFTAHSFSSLFSSTGGSLEHALCTHPCIYGAGICLHFLLQGGQDKQVGNVIPRLSKQGCPNPDFIVIYG